MGPILTDDAGRTLYLFTGDRRNISNCTDECAVTWPPLVTPADPTATPPVDETRLRMISRPDGSLQVTYNGWPLYHFAGDLRPGDVYGQSSGDAWFVVSAVGGPIQNNAIVLISAHPELGTILTDASGRTVYLFTVDERNKSNCFRGCGVAWPPLLTIGEPRAGEGVAGPSLATIDRGDGTAQVTYDGWPLYYFAPDEKPGDATGQNVADVWFVVSTAGGPIQTGASVSTSDHPVLGTILTDASGRTLYLFTMDVKGRSTCTGGCALVWPPVLTVGAPEAGSGVTSELAADYQAFIDKANKIIGNAESTLEDFASLSQVPPQPDFGLWTIVTGEDGVGYVTQVSDLAHVPEGAFKAYQYDTASGELVRTAQGASVPLTGEQRRSVAQWNTANGLSSRAAQYASAKQVTMVNEGAMIAFEEAKVRIANENRTIVEANAEWDAALLIDSKEKQQIVLDRLEIEQEKLLGEIAATNAKLLAIAEGEASITVGTAIAKEWEIDVPKLGGTFIEGWTESPEVWNSLFSKAQQAAAALDIKGAGIHELGLLNTMRRQLPPAAAEMRWDAVNRAVCQTDGLTDCHN